MHNNSNPKTIRGHFYIFISKLTRTQIILSLNSQVLPGQRLAQAIAGLLFAVHPIHSEAVAGIVGRADLLACLFAQGAFLFYVDHHDGDWPILKLGLTLGFSLLATLAKETGISSLALCLLWDFCHSEALLRKLRSRWANSSTLVAGSLAIITLGRLRLAGGRAPEFASADNPVARHPSRLARGLTFLYLPAASLGMLLCPCSLSFDWGMNAVPLLTGILDPRNLQSLLLYATLGLACLWALRRLRASVAPPAEHQPDPLLQQQQLLHQQKPIYDSCPVCAGRRTGACHTDGCRAANNNNGPVAECHCPKRRFHQTQQQQQQQHLRLSAAAAAMSSRRASSLLTILGFLVFPFLPASNLFFYVGFVIAERILYLPSVGACLGVAAAISQAHRLARRKGCPKIARAILLLTGLLLSCMAARTLWRNADWYNEENLYRSALRINPPKGILYTHTHIYI